MAEFKLQDSDHDCGAASFRNALRFNYGTAKLKIPAGLEQAKQRLCKDRTHNVQVDELRSLLAKFGAKIPRPIYLKNKDVSATRIGTALRSGGVVAAWTYWPVPPNDALDEHWILVTRQTADYVFAFDPWEGSRDRLPVYQRLRASRAQSWAPNCKIARGQFYSKADKPFGLGASQRRCLVFPRIVS